MFKNPAPPQDLSDENAKSIITPGFAALILQSVLVILYAAFYQTAPGGQNMLFLGIISLLYSSTLLWLLHYSPPNLQKWQNYISIGNGIATAIGLCALPEQINVIPLTSLVIVATITTILWSERQTAFYIGLAFFIHIGYTITIKNGLAWEHILHHGGALALTIVLVVILERLKNSHSTHTNRLQKINAFARQLSSTLEMEEIMPIIGDALSKALEAETYFLATVEGETLQVHMMYDDGKFFSDTSLPLKGSLSSWVIRNRRPLFIPDLRHGVNLEGVQTILTGNNRDNICWMGAPILAEHVTGIIVVASYAPNRFDRNDLELLENLAQQAAIVLDNVFHHTQVTEQARRDSLTGILNHSHIVRTLRQEAEKAQQTGQSLSLVMLDIDYFKQYNDNFGHQAGDEVLIALSRTLQNHLRQQDAVGRWGGEEFTIVLPNTHGRQAGEITERIRETIHTLAIYASNGKVLPFPTISQGVAVFPAETEDVDKLISLADQRLYIAKERGRNQIEPPVSHWDRMSE